ncbi:MAG: zf-HC2 domain-containing protein [Clostridiales bacterium]|jgi:hypothetical protein|nr:zf-HC2 domain-containing protein [Clostridiales bacterium]
MVKCDVIQDLLPLYIDNVASEGSREAIDEHLKSCPVCQEVLQNMQSVSDPARINVDKAEIGAFRKMKSKLRRKSVVMILAAVFATTIFCYGAAVVPFSIPYDAEKISAKLAYDEVIDIYYDGSYAGVDARADGDTLYIGYYGTVWSQIITPSERLQFSIGSNIAVDYGRSSTIIQLSEQIDKVYYVNYRQLRSDGSGVADEIEDAILIWERVK